MALGDRRDKTALAGLIGQFARRPMADGAPRRLRGLTGQGDDLTPLLRAERGWSTRSRGVLETRGHGLPRALAPVAAPAPDRGACRPEAACHFRGRAALRQQE